MKKEKIGYKKIKKLEFNISFIYNYCKDDFKYINVTKEGKYYDND